MDRRATYLVYINVWRGNPVLITDRAAALAAQIAINQLDTGVQVPAEIAAVCGMVERALVTS